MKNNTYISVLVLGILVLPMVVFAQPVFKPLVGVPGVTDPHINFNDYINTIYALSISIAALLAVIKIIIAGVKWMLSDVVTSKQEAKGEIQGALLGLLIIASAFLILNEINPNLTKTSLITSKVDRPTNYNTTPTGGSAPLGSGGGVTTPTSATQTNTPSGAPTTDDALWVEIGGLEQPVTMSENPAKPDKIINCPSSDTNCKNREQSACINERGQFTTSDGIIVCRYNTVRKLNCSDRKVEIPSALEGNKQYRSERNCYGALSLCQNRTPELQKTAWEQGNFSCPVPY